MKMKLMKILENYWVDLVYRILVVVGCFLISFNLIVLFAMRFINIFELIALSIILLQFVIRTAFYKW